MSGHTNSARGDCCACCGTDIVEAATLRTRLAAAEGRADRLEAALVSIANLTTGHRTVISASVHDTAMAALGAK